MDFSQFAVAKNRAKTGVLVKKMQIGSAIIGRLFFAHQAPPPLGHQAPASDKNKEKRHPHHEGRPRSKKNGAPCGGWWGALWWGVP